MPAISVLMPVRNAMPFLPSAVESILSQDYRDFEFLVLDDGSTDGSAAYLDSLADDRLRVTQHPHVGMCHLLNLGLAQAKAEYVARMDADDVALPGRLAAQVRELQANPQLVVLGCQAETIDGNDRPTGLWNLPVDDLGIKLMLLRDQTSLVHPGVMYRRSDVLHVGGYAVDQVSVEDRDLWWKLIERGRFGNLPQALMRYRRHDASVTGNRAQEQLRLTRKMTLTNLQRLKVVTTDESYDSFSAAGRLVRSGSFEKLGVAEFAEYVTILDSMLEYLERRCGADSAAVADHRKALWESLARYARDCDLRTARRFLPLLNRIAPSESRPHRLIARALGVYGRRLKSRWS